MERVREERVRFKKVGHGSLRIGHKIIKPNEVFLAYPSEIPNAFKDLVVAVDAKDANVLFNEDVKEEPIKVVAPEYFVKPRGKSKYLFDVVDARGKVLNEKPLKKEQAEALIKDLKG